MLACRLCTRKTSVDRKNSECLCSWELDFVWRVFAATSHHPLPKGAKQPVSSPWLVELPGPQGAGALFADLGIALGSCWALVTQQRWEGLQTGRQRQRNNLLHHVGYCWITVYAVSVPADLMHGNRVPLFLVLTLCIHAHTRWNYTFCDGSSFLQGKYFRSVAQ